jgi:hypothetical protein
METLRELVVSILFDADQSPLKELNQTTNQFQREMQKINPHLKEMGRELSYVNRMARQLNSSLDVDHQNKLNEMRQAFQEQQKAMREFHKQQIDVQHGYFQLAKSAKDYNGTNQQFIDEINKLGQQQKKITDNMIKQNELLKMSFFASIGAMLARSTQSEKIAENFNRMGNPLYRVNNGLLKVTGSLEKMAKQGNAAVLALKMLGPTADMKKLRDMTMMINQGLMRYQSVSLAAAVVSGVMLVSLTKAAMGPNPADVRARQNEITNIYKQAFAQRVDEIRNFVGLFEKANLEPVKKADLTKALQSQVTAIRTWMTNLQGLAKKGVDQGLIKELQKAGPAAAMQVKALNSMSKPELDKYVALWREKNALARQQATSELAKLRQETQQKIRALQQSLMPLGVEFEKFKKVWASALKPFVDMFSLIAAKVLHVGTVIGQFFDRLNKINPIITKMIFGFLALIPILTLLLAPLSIGIGLFNGLRAAFASVWMIIGPFVTGLGAMLGTVTLIAGAIVGLSAAFYLLWTRSETFRNAVITGWNAIKATALQVWGFISPYIMQAISAVSMFIQQKLQQIHQFWNQNGAMIMAAAQRVWTVIRAVVVTQIGALVIGVKVAFTLLASVVRAVWGNVKLIINGALNVILGIIRTFAALLTGNWRSAWEGVKQIVRGALQFLRGINLFSIGRNIIQGLVNGIGSMAGAVVAKVKAIGSSIKSTISKFLGIHSPSRVMMEIGAFTTQGFALGIQKEIPLVQQASLALAQEPLAAQPSSYTTNNSSRSIVFSPTVYVTVEGGDAKVENNVKAAVKEAFEEMFGNLLDIYETEVVR